MDYKGLWELQIPKIQRNGKKLHTDMEKISNIRAPGLQAKKSLKAKG